MNKTLLLAAMVAAAWRASAPAQVYPSRPITMIVPFPAGGPSDVVPRILSDRLRTTLGQSIVIENVSGAGGSIGMGRVARAAPDGYTVGVGSWSTGVVNGAIYNLNYDVVADFEPVVLLPENPLFITSKKAVPAKNLGELVAWVKASGDKVLVATSGVGTSPHVAGVMLQRLTGAPIQLVHYRGGAPALQDLLGGHVPASVNPISETLAQAKSGAVRILGVTGARRSPFLPDVPTMREQGYDVVAEAWLGALVPAKTPAEIVGALSTAIADVTRSPEFGISLAKFGNEPAFRSPEQFAATVKADIARWAPIVKASGFVAED